MTLFDGVSETAVADLGFATATLDRAGWRRENAGWQQEALEDPQTRFVLICNDTPVLNFDAGKLDALFTKAGAEAVSDSKQYLFLGMERDTPHFGVHIDPLMFDELKARTDLKLIDMRSIVMQGLFSNGTANAIGTAKAMFMWHKRHAFCSNCGQPSVSASAGWKRFCAACKSEHFPRTDPVVIMLAVDGDKCLMGRSPHFPEGRYSCLAGFMEPGETIEQATRREIIEETGIKTGRVRYITAQPWPFPSSLMIGCFAEATSSEITIDAAELADARWFTRDEIKLILKGEHPKGITAPPNMAIAHHIMSLFANLD
ncbi:MAG: NAD(+) diphosphatase [Beijerinckiaceae bacterium]